MGWWQILALESRGHNGLELLPSRWCHGVGAEPEGVEDAPRAPSSRHRCRAWGRWQGTPMGGRIPVSAAVVYQGGEAGASLAAELSALRTEAALQADGRCQRGSASPVPHLGAAFISSCLCTGAAPHCFAPPSCFPAAGTAQGVRSPFPIPFLVLFWLCREPAVAQMSSHPRDLRAASCKSMARLEDALARGQIPL